MLATKLDLTHMDLEARRRLQDADWADIGIRLTAYAMWKARNYRRRTHQVWALAAGKTPEDVAREAIVKVLDGSRQWDPQRGPLLPYLEGIVDSLMSHLAASSDNAMLQRWNEQGPESDATRMNEDADADLIERLRTALRHDGADELLAILDVVHGCGARPRALAAALQTSVNDINNRLKRLRRAALRVLHATPREKV